MDIFLTALLAFVSTNIDDLFLLVLFFGDKRFKTLHICLGQYLGIGFLVVISLIGSSIGQVINAQYIGLLGLFPIYLGVRQFIELLNSKNNNSTTESYKAPNSNSGFLGIAFVTIANGGDNIGTYIPLFTSLDQAEIFVLLFMFLLLVAVWLIVAKYLTHHPVLAKTIDRYGHILTPLVLCLLGVYILYENGSFGLLNYW